VLPHRQQGGKSRKKPGMNVADMLDASLDTVLLHNFEPDADLLATDDAVEKLARQEFVIALTPYDSAAIREAADLLLPIGTFAETSGTYVNVAGTWQSFGGIANPVGESRPAWKVLRVLGNLVEADGFDYVTSEDVLAELKQQLGDIAMDNSYKGSKALAKANGADAPSGDIDVPLYSIDGVVRRARALQLTDEAMRTSGEASDG
jgi:NADH-quinone oxidoreductase subunit G